MVNNLTQGPIEVFDASVGSINLAFAQVVECLDQLKGLRGRALVYDRVRIDSPVVDEDAVDLQSLVTQEIRWRIVFLPSSLIAFPAGTSYVELGTQYRQQVDLTDLTSPEARMLIAGFGTESGSTKGVAMTKDDGTVLAEVTWDGQSEALYSGNFTTITETTDQQVQIRTKGSSATEALVLRYAVCEFKGIIQTVQT